MIHGRGGPQPLTAALGWPATPTFKTKSLKEAQQHLKAYDVSAALDIGQTGFFGGYSESFVHLRNISVSLSRVDSPDGYDLGLKPSNEYCLNIPMQGEGWVVNGSQIIEIDHTQALFVSPACDITKHWAGPGEVITVHIPAYFLHSNPEFALPRTIAPISVIDRARLDDFLGLVATLYSACSDRGSPMADEAVINHLESAAVGTLMQSLPNRPGGAALRTPSMPYYVRRADHYMRANFRPGVTLKDVAGAACVSERTLHYGFRNCYGKTPLQFFKHLRLTSARRQITEGLNGRTLAEIAWAVGYRKASQFAEDYRALFGENPSQTARHSAHASIELPPPGGRG